MREYKVYKDYDVLELTQDESFALSICLYAQTDFVDRYFRLVDSGTASNVTLARHKSYAQHAVTQTWVYLMRIFPGLDNSMSIGIDDDKPFNLRRFYVITMPTALEKLVKDDNSRRVFTPEWEAAIEAYKASH